MFEDLTRKFDNAFRFITGKGKITDENIELLLREVRRVLLEADVNYKVSKQFADTIKQKISEKNIQQSINPGKLIIDTINEELTALMGDKRTDIKFSQNIPSIIMLAGLQGSGKTTFAAKRAQ